jgi:hypothetical protein
MTRICLAPGCAAETSSRYSPYCSTHRGRIRRQGDVEQRAVTKTELASYQRLVQARIERNPSSPAWDRLDDAWLHVVSHARGVLAAEKQGRAGVRHERIAAREVVTLGDAVSARADAGHCGERLGQRLLGDAALPRVPIADVEGGAGGTEG